MVGWLPLIFTVANAVTIACIGLPQHLVVLNRDLRSCTITHLIFVQNRHAYLDAVLSDLKCLLHLIEDWLLVQNAAALGLERFQETVEIIILLALVLARLFLRLHRARLASLLFVVVQRALLHDLLRRLIRILNQLLTLNPRGLISRLPLLVALPLPLPFLIVAFLL